MKIINISIGYNNLETEKIIFNPSENIFENNYFTLTNKYTKSKETSIFTLDIAAKNKITLNKLYIEIEYNFNKEEKIFINGFQSWSLSQQYSATEQRPGLCKNSKSHWQKYKLDLYGDYKFIDYYDNEKSFHSHNYTYIKNHNQYFLLGSLLEKYGYTVFKYEIDNNKIIVYKDIEGLSLEPKINYEILKIFQTSGNYKKVFEDYFNNLNIKKPTSNPVTGWTSWYNYFQNIDQKTVLENLNNFYEKKIPIDFFQIDDGYQQKVGDWLITNNKFPDGMKNLAEKIHNKEYKAGLWIAPFICEKESQLFKEHPEWILKDQHGKMVLAGSNSINWSGDFYALDFYNNNFKEYLKTVFETVLNEWNFDLIKLDFLYAVALIPYNGKSRGQIMQEAMIFLREISKDKLLLGCGVPLGNSFGIVDYCRIGCDIGLYWEDFEGAKSNYVERISTYNSLTDSINRAHLNNKAFLNDPDVFIIRSENNQLSKEQRITNFLVNQIFGSIVFTSDNIANYDQETMNLYLSQFPFTNKDIINIDVENNLYKVSFFINNQDYIAFINLSNSKKNYQLDENTYFNKETSFVSNNTFSLNAFESICFLKLNKNSFQIAGSFSHFFAGNEVESLSESKNNISIIFSKQSKLPLHVLIKIPDECDGYMVNNKYCKATKTLNMKIIEYKPD